MRSNAVISIVVACSLMPHSSSWLHRCVYGAAMLPGADSDNGNLTASLCRSRRPPLRTGGRCRIRTVRNAPVPPNWSTQAHRSHTTCCRVCASFSRPRRTTAYARARERLSQSALLRSCYGKSAYSPFRYTKHASASLWRSIRKFQARPFKSTRQPQTVAHPPAPPPLLSALAHAGVAAWGPTTEAPLTGVVGQRGSR
jgi:hypothetical protein